MPATALQTGRLTKCPRGECRVQGFSSRHSLISTDKPGKGTISYRICGGVEGEKKRPAILFLSGWGCTPKIWQPTAPHLIPDFDLIFVENRGQGHSRIGSTTPERYFPVMAEDIKDILDRERIDKALVVGHSMGGIIAKEFALRFPETAKGVVFVCSPHGNPLRTWVLGDGRYVNTAVNALSALLQHTPGADIVKRELIARHPLFRALSSGLLLGTDSGKNQIFRRAPSHEGDGSCASAGYALIRKILAKSTRVPLVSPMGELPTRLGDGAKKYYETTYRHFLRVDIRTLAIQLEAMRAAVPTDGMLSPALYIWGEDDRLVTWESAYLDTRGKEMRPGSVAIRLERTGHFPSFECPERLAGIIREFAWEVLLSR